MPWQNLVHLSSDKALYVNGVTLFSNQSATKVGLLAGSMAMMIAMLAMQLISRIIGPWLLLTEYMTAMTMRQLLGLTGEFARFLLSGNSRLRITIILMVLLLAAGTGLGHWANQRIGDLHQSVMQAAAILMIVTSTLIYLLDARTLEYFLQELLLTLALSFLVYAVVLHRLLEPNTNTTRWRIAFVATILSLIVILRDVWAM